MPSSGEPPVESDSQRTTRRAFLGAVGAAAAGLAGCSADPASDTEATGATTTAGTERASGTPSPSPSPSPSGTETADGVGGSGESVYTRLYRQVIDSVVLVRVPGGGLGSGFLYDGNHVVTNHHVVTDSGRVTVQFSKGQSVTGTVVGTDKYSDLAVIRVRNAPQYAEPMSLVSEEPAIGTRAAAIGSPYGLEGSLTTGVVSGVNRVVPSPNADFSIPNAIQTDAPVNPGNSGGPLVNLDGEVLGVVNSGGGDNIAFAISAPLVQRVVPALIQDGQYRHPFVGVTVVDVTKAVARANNLDRTRGVLVRSVVDGSPAAGTLQPSTGTKRVDGFQVPVGGDVILAVEGQRVSSRQELASYLELHASPGDPVTFTVLRNGERQKVTLTPVARRTS